MKQIKTIVCSMNQTAEFDAEVNAALKHGWELTKREPLPMGTTIDGVHYSSAVLLAELEIDAECGTCRHLYVNEHDEPCKSCFCCVDEAETVVKWEPRE